MNCLFCYNNVDTKVTHYKCNNCHLIYHLNCWTVWVNTKIKNNNNNKESNDVFIVKIK